jgi:16S rRNA (uracil1498-N3)-methyltransferase
MQSPFFYIKEHDPSLKQLELDEDTSRHIVQVLRMKTGARVHLTDGQGYLLTASIADDHKKHCLVNIDSSSYQQPAPRKITIGISLIKNSSRLEWFLEKATEIGVQEIIPLICERTEKQKFRRDRMQGILISAMLQSQQCWLPVLHEPIAYTLLFRQEEIAGMQQKFIAHCMEGNKQSISQLSKGEESDYKFQNPLILIGPEGDFTSEEVALALANHFLPVSLGATRLRTETAGVVAATLLRPW